MNCLMDGCALPVHTRGVCMKHYHQARRNGTDSTLPRVKRGGGRCVACEEPVYSNGYCTLHYQRVRRLGTTELPEQPTPDQRVFGNAQEQEDGCLVWQGRTAHNGYGVISVGNRSTYAHRVAYELRVGPIPSGLTIDHLCFNRMCINPEHLEAVTRSENTRRELIRRYSERN